MPRSVSGLALVCLLLPLILVGGCGKDDEDRPDAPLPQAGNVYPPDGATGIAPVVALTWTAEDTPVKAFQHYRVLMGGSPGTLALVGNAVATHYVRRGLALGATYYWAVEAVGDAGDTTRGGPWSFTTVDALPAPAITLELNGEPWAAVDTVGYGRPIAFTWSASSPLAASVPPAALALLDTLAPSSDGILGYQYAFGAGIPGDDDWQPRGLDDAPYFGDVQELVVSDPPASASYQLYVNALDFAGGTVPLASQAIRLVVNFDPDTRIERTRTYPYYVVFHGPEAGEYNFADGDTVPDGAYVVVKATGWDDPRDLPLDPPGQLRFQGNFQARGLYEGHSPFTFAATYSAPDTADTLGFLVGPFDYTVTMRALDEHDRRDGSPDTLRFHGNFPPCVQCIELLNLDAAPTFTDEGGCVDQACLAPVTTLRAPLGASSSPTDLSLIAAQDTIWVDAAGWDVRFSAPRDPSSFKIVLAKHFGYVAYLHGKNPPREHWPAGHPDRRIAAWRYQIDHDGDAYNIIRDGGGYDDLGSLSGFQFEMNVPDPRRRDLFIRDDGAWGVTVAVGVAQILQTGGPAAYWAYLRSPILYNAPPAPPSGSDPAVVCAWQRDPAVQLAYRAWQLTTMQFTPGAVRAIASDASRCTWRTETNAYHYYEGVRVPPIHGRRCEPGAYDDPDHQEAGMIDLEYFPTYSGEAVKRFQIEVETTAGTFVGGGDPPGWLACGAKWSRAPRR